LHQTLCALWRYSGGVKIRFGFDDRLDQVGINPVFGGGSMDEGVDG
jgi:hypothetical protein